MDALARFRKAAASQQFRLGQFDCGIMCADWVLERRGVDPAIIHRSAYSTPLGLARLLKRRGGLVGHFDTCLKACHIERTDRPRRGDVVIVETPQGLTGGIVTGPLVLLAGGNGGIIERSLKYAPIVAAWRI